MIIYTVSTNITTDTCMYCLEISDNTSIGISILLRYDMNGMNACIQMVGGFSSEKKIVAGFDILEENNSSSTNSGFFLYLVSCFNSLCLGSTINNGACSRSVVCNDPVFLC